MKIGKGWALLLVDVQNDFCPGGALPVPDGDLVVEPLSRVAQLFAAAGLPVIASRDWHPKRTSHFKEFGGGWPPHCVQGTAGAAFHAGLKFPPMTIVISKGNEPESDCYSAFDGRDENGRALLQILNSLEINHLMVGGLATEYCIRASVLDALNNGLNVTVLSDGIAGVEINPGDSSKANDEMKAAGAIFHTVAKMMG